MQQRPECQAGRKPKENGFAKRSRIFPRLPESQKARYVKGTRDQECRDREASQSIESSPDIGELHGIGSDDRTRVCWEREQRVRVGVRSSRVGSELDASELPRDAFAMPGWILLANLECGFQAAYDFANGHAIATDGDGIVAVQPCLHFPLG